MELAIVACQKIIQMSFILLLGVFLFKKKMIDESMIDKLSDLLLMVIAPILILTSFQIEFNSEVLKDLLTAFLLSAISFILVILLSYLCIPQKENDVSIERMTAIYSNCGFIGIPLIHGLFGKTGVFYVTTYLTIFNIFFWTHGIICMSGKMKVKEAMKKLCTPSIFAVIMGVFLFCFRIHIPDILLEPLEMTGNMNTPLAMIVTGAILAKQEIRRSFKKMRIYYVAVIKLFLLPLAFLLLLLPIEIEKTLAMTLLVATACPAAASTTIVAVKYGKDSGYASELFAITTIFSIITIPIIVLIGMAVL